MNIEKIAAGILVECGYAMYSKDMGKFLWWERGTMLSYDNWSELCEPFSDTLSGRRQLDAIEDWICANHMTMYIGDSASHVPSNSNYHQWRMDRVRWCLEQLEGVNND